jgi:hypothetical protein
MFIQAGRGKSVHHMRTNVTNCSYALSGAVSGTIRVQEARPSQERRQVLFHKEPTGRCAAEGSLLHGIGWVQQAVLIAVVHLSPAGSLRPDCPGGLGASGAPGPHLPRPSAPTVVGTVGARLLCMLITCNNPNSLYWWPRIQYLISSLAEQSGRRLCEYESCLARAHVKVRSGNYTSSILTRDWVKRGR